MSSYPAEPSSRGAGPSFSPDRPEETSGVFSYFPALFPLSGIEQGAIHMALGGRELVQCFLPTIFLRTADCGVP